MCNNLILNLMENTMNKAKISYKDQYKMYLLSLTLNNIEDTYELKTMSYDEFVCSELCTKNIEEDGKLW